MKIHSTAEVQTHFVGHGTTVWQHSVVLQGAKIGSSCNINAFCFIENDVKIGDRVTVKCGVYLWDGIEIGNDVFIGPNATFTNDKIPRSKVYPESFQRTVIEEGASIGANATILGGVRIGAHSLIGAGSVVTKDIPPYTVWFGNPAQIRGYICSCGHHLSELTCTSCDTQYELHLGNLKPQHNDRFSEPGTHKRAI